MNVDKLMGNQISVQVTEIVAETDTACTILFKIADPEFKVAPGQFLMVWVPGVDEIPMSISLWDPPNVGITVLPIGHATTSLTTLQRGDWIGIRGPFGSSFNLESKRALVVGGGIGMAPLRPLVYQLLEKGTNVTILIAAKSKQELVFLEEFSRLSEKGLTVTTATDDGSSGFKGLAPNAVCNDLNIHDFDTVYTCGPELMMFRLFEQVSDSEVRFQASLERFMKCGSGICGTCAMDPSGTLVCVDGPVYTETQLSEITEFGKYHRDAMGLKKIF
ncbi:MAG: dihydroorotate dehydrogenase electron transfer subunit [Candidatus Thorarchaeota archaeon]|jgi:dihydroorotate dehydrogenase electron transfer subunit